VANITFTHKADSIILEAKVNGNGPVIRFVVARVNADGKKQGAEARAKALTAFVASAEKATGVTVVEPAPEPETPKAEKAPKVVKAKVAKASTNGKGHAGPRPAPKPAAKKAAKKAAAASK